MPIQHISLPISTSTLEESTAFYTALLKPLGYDVTLKLETAVGLGTKNAGSDFWLHVANQKEGVGKTHVAFAAGSKEEVDQFYEAGLKAGGKDNGPPGERPQYSKGYYAAFVLDLEGNNVECIFYRP